MKPMKLETPVLPLKRTGHWYVDGPHAWVCRDELSEWFVRTPEKISLSISTRPDKLAVKIELRCDRRIATWAEIDGYDLSLCDALSELADQFLDAGHKTVYVTLWEHE